MPFLKQYHDRITHVHVKDRKLNNGPNVPFGQGDTPIKEVLQLMRDNKWKFQATIEFEYPVPEGSDRKTELAKTIAYCKSCLAVVPQPRGCAGGHVAGATSSSACLLTRSPATLRTSGGLAEWSCPVEK